MMIFYLLEMPRKSSYVKKNVIDESPKSITVEVPAVDSPLKRGRKVKYQTDEERREARREQNRRYRERKKNELITLRRAAAKREKESVTQPQEDKNNSDEQIDAIPIDL